MKVEFENIDELIQALEHVGQAGESFKKEALETAGKELQQEARRIVRKRTRNLERHIMLSNVENDEIEVYVDNQGPAYYGHMLEFGTSKMQAYPFMAPAFTRKQWKIEKIISDTLRKRLEMP